MTNAKTKKLFHLLLPIFCCKLIWFDLFSRNQVTKSRSAKMFYKTKNKTNGWGGSHLKHLQSTVSVGQQKGTHMMLQSDKLKIIRQFLDGAENFPLWTELPYCKYIITWSTVSAIMATLSHRWTGKKIMNFFIALRKQEMNSIHTHIQLLKPIENVIGQSNKGWYRIIPVFS